MARLAEGVTALRAHLAGWRYGEGGKRDQRLDFLRGYCVVAMAVDHLGANSWLALLTGGNRFFVSAAEGFLFLSGLVMGVVYRSLVGRAGLGAAAGKALRRALRLYGLTVGATLGFMGLSAGLGLPWGRGADPVAALGTVLALRRTFYLTDVLLLYTVLVALAPLAFALLRRRGGWAALLGLSWGLWGLHQLHPIQLPWPSEDDAFYYIAAWQVLFLTGLVVGWHRERVGAAVGRLGAWRVLAGGAGGVAALVVVWAWLSGEIGRVDAGAAERAWAEYAKWSLPPGRVVACAVVFAFAFALVDRCWRPLRSGVGWLVLPLGRSALAAYVVHLGAVGALTAAGQALARGAALTRGQTTLQQAAAIGLVWLGVRGWAAARAGGPVLARAGGSALARGARELAATLVGGAVLGRPSGALLVRAGVGLVAAIVLLAGPTSETTSAALLAAPSPIVVVAGGDGRWMGGQPPALPVTSTEGIALQPLASGG